MPTLNPQLGALATHFMEEQQPHAPKVQMKQYQKPCNFNSFLASQIWPLLLLVYNVHLISMQ